MGVPDTIVEMVVWLFGKDTRNRMVGLGQGTMVGNLSDFEMDRWHILRRYQ